MNKTRNKPDKNLKINDYVMVSHWEDATPDDPWAVGFLQEISQTHGGYYFRIYDNPRYYRWYRKITKREGAKICKEYPSLEKCNPQNRKRQTPQ
jgi:hypothetical protein